ncbi:ATP phosphoribosyltransferase regulatory subunit [Azorhizobium sp. AG788]|uniref:ATP phosphoribosyltransferase regulatory subunit n=1 Tax=Azorhizobium sp. AG788 TaxID=2183897 RepID=UPI001060EA21|nr:ATP phosphoribosyltransferase regulatory subunit [Azorhizobium sp. AG788]TDT93569.1 ATP phosphoribosyltransferase regulatory subunit [Azorhizobium sp. AG788]
MPIEAQSPPLLRDSSALDEALMARFASAGFLRLDPPILQPADAFLDLSGETIRRSMFLTSSEDGQELCLRPDLTIPVAREVQRLQLPMPAAVSYLGPVFRSHSGGAGEFRQAGVESFGRADTAAADADILALGLETCAIYGVPDPEILIGDVGLFSAVLEALPLAPAWRRRLMKDFGQGRLDEDIANLSESEAKGTAAVHAGVLSALAGSDPDAARALITDLLSIAGITTVGGRTVSEIAARFLEQAALEGNGLSAETAAILSRYLAITGAPGPALEQVRALANEARIDISGALAAFEERASHLAAHGVNLSEVEFSAAFGRPLDYYSGMVFELSDPEGRVAAPLVAGGRYDRLMSRLGAETVVPAVGFAAWVERLALLESQS